MKTYYRLRDDANLDMWGEFSEYGMFISEDEVHSLVREWSEGRDDDEAQKIHDECMDDLRTVSLPDLDNDELAQAIADGDAWDLDELQELCRRAGMSAEWEAADGDTFEEVADEAAKKLGVSIY